MPSGHVQSHGVHPSPDRQSKPACPLIHLRQPPRADRSTAERLAHTGLRRVRGRATTTLFTGLIVAAVSLAAERGDLVAQTSRAAEPAKDASKPSARADETLRSQLTPLRPNIEIQRYAVVAGNAEAATVPDDGDAARGTSKLVYSNTLGRFVLGPAGRLFDVRIADDITTTVTRSESCMLDRFVLRVTGDRDQDGTGTALGEFTVRYALYEYCPGAHIFPRTIPGTEVDDFFVSAAQAGDLIEIEHRPIGVVNLPSNVYLGVSFSREKCGVVVGAPPTHGFSADRFDYPGFPCSAGLGGFPESQHASFYAEIYVRGECSDSYVGYKNSNHAGTPFSAGRSKLFADDIRLAVDECNLIGYQIAHKGNGIIQVDLKTALSATDPENGNLIPGTRAFIFSYGDDILVHNQSFAPFDLSAHDQVWVAFKTSTADAGPVLTCEAPALGDTANLHMVWGEQDGWTTLDGGKGCRLDFDVTLFCEGAPPIGACCDMILTDNDECVGGSHHGNVCADGFDCPGGKCIGDSVCRELPEMNCAFPERWNEGYRCNPVCVGGANHGELCSNDQECTVCIGGRNDGGSCVSDEQCSLCIGGTRDDETCCPAGSCDEATDLCDGGDRDGQECCPDDGACSPGICPTGECRGSFCVGGANSGQPCAQQSDCPGGDCDGRDGGAFFDHPCGDSACCKLDGTCEDTTERACHEILPLDYPRPYQFGEFCGESQTCPIPCIMRFSECTQPRNAVCIAGPEEGGECNPDVNDCDAVCVGGIDEGLPCRFPQDCKGEYAGCGRSVCVGGIRDGELCAFELSDEHCPGEDSTCSQPLCKGMPCCENACCCWQVCTASGMPWCCTVHWDAACAEEAFRVCTHQPANDECYSRERNHGARLVEIPSTTVGDHINATQGSDPGFCCHADDPGADGYATLWYKFVATDTSARFSTCCSTATETDEGIFLAQDSLIEVFSVSDPDLGLCRDRLTRCSVSEQDCVDGFKCELDEETVCRKLNVVACSDDEETCSCGGVSWPNRSKVCVTDLTPGELYYVMVAAKTNTYTVNQNGVRVYADLGVYTLNISAPCTVDRKLLPNDLCQNAEVLTGGDTDPLVVPFDLSGGLDYAPPEFVCPGPSRLCMSTLENDVWYDWTSPCRGEATIDTCEWVCDGGSDRSQPCEDDFDCTNPGKCRTPDTGLAVYRGCECPVEIPRELVCSDFEPYPCYLGSRVTFDVAEGACYKLRLGGHRGGEPAGNMTINLTCDCPEVVIETVPVGNPGNANDIHGDGYGGVGYVYNIGMFEVTAGQYTEFLNAVAGKAHYELYDTDMSDPTAGTYGCNIQQDCSSGSCTYSVATLWENRPVNYVSWGDAARFANWLHNGQPTGAQDLSTTEDGSYYLNGATTNGELMAIVRELDATWVIPSEDEWYKAAYHHNDGVTGNYWDYPTSNDSEPGYVNNGGNLSGTGDPFVEGGTDPGNYATYDGDGGTNGIGPPYYLTNVGEWENSDSPYGTFDQGGNAWEWNEAVLYGSYRGVRGGSFDYNDYYLLAAARNYNYPTGEGYGLGFRVAEVAEPDCTHDGDEDEDVDLYDFALYQATFTDARCYALFHMAFNGPQ